MWSQEHRDLFLSKGRLAHRMPQPVGCAAELGMVPAFCSGSGRCGFRRYLAVSGALHFCLRSNPVDAYEAGLILLCLVRVYKVPFQYR